MVSSLTFSYISEPWLHTKLTCLNIWRIDEKVDTIDGYLSLLVLRIGPTLMMQVSLQTFEQKIHQCFTLGKTCSPRGLPNFWAYTLKAIGGGTGLPGLLFFSPLQNLSAKT
jgi:hypothetical protein